MVLTKTIAEFLNRLTILLTDPFRTVFYHFMRTTCLAVLLSFVVTASAAELPEGVRRMKVLNYPDCFELSNADTRVTLCHQVGGRVLEDACWSIPSRGPTRFTSTRRRANGARPAGQARRIVLAASTSGRSI